MNKTIFEKKIIQRGLFILNTSISAFAFCRMQERPVINRLSDTLGSIKRYPEFFSESSLKRSRACLSQPHKIFTTIYTYFSKIVLFIHFSFIIHILYTYVSEEYPSILQILVRHNFPNSPNRMSSSSLNAESTKLVRVGSITSTTPGQVADKAWEIMQKKSIYTLVIHLRIAFTNWINNKLVSIE